MLLMQPASRRLMLLVDRVLGVAAVDVGSRGAGAVCSGVRRLGGTATLLVDDVLAMLTEDAAAACREALRGSQETGG
jgi:hypothetical protein